MERWLARGCPACLPVVQVMLSTQQGSRAPRAYRGRVKTESALNMAAGGWGRNFLCVPKHGFRFPKPKNTGIVRDAIVDHINKAILLSMVVVIYAGESFPPPSNHTYRQASSTATRSQTKAILSYKASIGQILFASIAKHRTKETRPNTEDTPNHGILS